MTPILLSIAYSPWSERARWALQARGVAFTSRTYQPLIGEPELRLRLGKWRGVVSVPVLLADDGPLADSFLIAQYAAQHASGPDLLPAAHAAEIAEWNRQSERGLDAGRALSLARVLQRPDALLELVPKSLRALPGAQLIAAAGVRRTLHKYHAAPEGNAQTLAAVLDRLRAALAASPSRSEPRTLLADFSYADITMAQVLAFVKPPATGLKMGRANRAAFEDPELAQSYADLLTWRDALYAKWRS